MITWIREFLASPVFEDEDKTRIAGLLNTILLAVLALSVMYGIFSPIIYSNPVPMLAVVAGVVVPLGLGMLSLMRSGRVQLASMLFSSALWVIVTLVAVASGGTRTPGFSTYITVILIAGLLLGARAGIGFAGLSTLAGLGMLYAEINGLLPPSLIPITPVSAWGGLTVNFILAAMMLRLATRNIANALERARRNERALAESNRELQARTRELERREETLRESERRSRLLAENVTDVIWTIDMNLQFTYFSPSVVYIGYTVEEAMTLMVEEFLTPASFEVAMKIFVEELAGENMEQMGPFSSRTLELEVNCKDGSTVWTEARMSFLRDAGGRPIGILGVARDITERKRAEGERERRSQELTMLNEIGRAVTSSLDFNKVLALLLDWARQGLGAEACSVALLEDNGDVVFHHAEGEGAEAVIRLRLKPGQGIAGHVAQSGQSALVPDAYADSRFYGEVAPGFTTRDMVCVPLVVRDEIIGVIELLNKHQGMFAEDDVQVLESVASQAATAIENARLFGEARQRVAELEALRRTSLQLTSSLDLSAVLDSIAESALTLVGATDCHIYLYDEANETFTFGAALWEDGRREAAVKAPRRDGFTATVAREGCPMVINDVAHHPLYATPEAQKWNLQAIAGFLLKRAGRVLGVFNIAFLEPHTFSEEELRVLGLLADQAAIAIENARLFGDVEQARAEWEATFQAIGDGISIHDSGLRLVRVNHALAERLGTAPEALVGHTCYELFHHTTTPPPWCPHLKATETGQPQTVEIEQPVLDGTFLISAYPLFDEQGQVSGSVHVLKDITERKQLEAQLRQAQKMESIGQLAGGIAHDFNNLLTPIGGFSELLLGKAPEGSQQQEHLRQIKVAAERAAALTGQLLLFTRQARGERRSVQLNSVVEETRDLLERSIPKEITIELRLASELWAVEADSSQISQVLMNLCVNARDAMPDGGTLTLETRNVTLDEEYAQAILEARPGRYVCLSVSDTGGGMSPEVQARLFEPFFTTKEVGKGTGLGLAVVYGIVKGHDGFLNVYSQEGRGSTLHVYLPAIELAVEERGIEGLELPTGTETILLVDDEEMVRALGQAVLEPCGYTVLMAEDGLQALEVYQAHQREIALVVLDVIMPQMGGLECLRRLQELDPRVRVLISTGYTVGGLAQELVAEGALGVVEKPFRIQDFATAVRVALDQP